MDLLRALFFYLVAVLSFFIGTLMTFPFTWFSKDKVRIYQRSARIWSQMLMFISGIPVKVEGKENIPQNEPVILVSNHQGAMDILILLAELPVYFRFIIKKELFRIPFFGWYLRKAGYLSVDRGSGEKAHKMMSETSSVISSGNNILIFPEGTRTLTGKLQEFKRGSMLLAFKAKVRVVPIAISGSFDIMPPKSVIFKNVPVAIRIGKPVSIEKYGTNYEKALEDIHDIIERML